MNCVVFHAKITSTACVWNRWQTRLLSRDYIKWWYWQFCQKGPFYTIQPSSFVNTGQKVVSPTHNIPTLEIQVPFRVGDPIWLDHDVKPITSSVSLAWTSLAACDRLDVMIRQCRIANPKRLLATCDISENEIYANHGPRSDQVTF